MENEFKIFNKGQNIEIDESDYDSNTIGNNDTWSTSEEVNDKFINKKESQELTMIQLNELKKEEINIGEMTQQMSVDRIFNLKDYYIINLPQLFVACFNKIPNISTTRFFDTHKAIYWLIKTYKNDIKNCYSRGAFICKNEKKHSFSIIYIIFYNEILLELHMVKGGCINYYYSNKAIDKVEDLLKNISQFRIRTIKKRIPSINLVVTTEMGFGTSSFEIPKPKLLIRDNYNDDFFGIHNTIFKRLSKKNDKGLILLHGKPGTGKTSYIRFLITLLKKKIIFLPPNLACGITNPSLMSILMDNPNSIFVIEDAENIIIDREASAGSPVTALLNISDGLLSDCLNIQIICSFNVDINKVDNALLRKGRLIAKYEFKELETDKAQALSTKLGFDTEITKPMTLTEIYNQDEKDFQQQKQRQKIGFAIN